MACHVPLSSARSSANDFCTCSGVSRSSRSARAAASAHSGDVSRLKLVSVFWDGFLKSFIDSLCLLDDILAFSIVVFDMAMIIILCYYWVTGNNRGDVCSIEDRKTVTAKSIIYCARPQRLYYYYNMTGLRESGTIKILQ